MQRLEVVGVVAVAAQDPGLGVLRCGPTLERTPTGLVADSAVLAGGVTNVLGLGSVIVELTWTVAGLAVCVVLGRHPVLAKGSVTRVTFLGATVFTGAAHGLYPAVAAGRRE